ncbi:nucleotide disphospho-sugar-binding domain-containing protein [Streptomyces sp. PTD9-10]|uniref:nucleotide disphospho-sugar-binding domain-containing protein n=1 Tax=unclassified Streptomyces TaxID=2593676 RepID=UPI00300B6F74
MRVLMMSSPLASHFAAMVPLAWALRAAGHEVLGAGRPDMAAAPLSAGLSAVTMGEPVGFNEQLARYLPAGMRPVQAFGRGLFDRIEQGCEQWFLDDLVVLPEYLDFARRWRPDLVVSEQIDFAGTVVAGALGVPHVRHRWGVDPLSGPLGGMAAELFGPLCEKLGLGGLPESALVLDPCPPELQLPEAAAGVPIRPVPFNGNGRLPSWARRGERRRVCVSLGNQTLLLNGVPLFRHVIDAFDGLDDLEVLVTVAPEYREALGEPPTSVRLVDPAPLSLFLADCDLLVHHGGAGTAMTATTVGIPQLILPQIADQFFHADRIVAAGAAIALEDAADQDNPRLVRQAALDLLGDDRHRKAARVLRDAVEAMPAPADLVPDLEALAADERPVRR